MEFAPKWIAWEITRRCNLKCIHCRSSSEIEVKEHPDFSKEEAFRILDDIASYATPVSENGMPAIFRSQPERRERLYRGEEGSLFQHWMQRRLLNRFALGHAAEKHSGLGLAAYVTATSPIRKYFDLVTQRQVRAVLGLEEPYSAEEVDRLIQELSVPMSRVGRLQVGRQRYWLLRYLEQRIGQEEEAIVLVRRRHCYQVLLTDYMLECDLAIAGSFELKPEDLIQVTLQNVSARKDLVALTIG